MTTSGFQLLTIARTELPEQAQGLSETLSALKQFGAMAAGQLVGEKKQLAQHALDSLQIGAQGNELSLQLEVAEADLTALTRLFHRSE
jgi:hypothetical protein